jgi:hypothetical protein
MGREDLHKNMEDTFDDKEIIQTNEMFAYDCKFFICTHAYLFIVVFLGRDWKKLEFKTFSLFFSLSFDTSFRRD